MQKKSSQDLNDSVKPYTTQTINIKVIIQKNGAETSELIEDVDISEFVEESGVLILKKLVMLLKTEYNFPLESN